jgi:hypothetical protein
VSRRFFDDDEISETPAERSGRVTFDDRGNAVWAAARRKRTAQPVLSLAEEAVPVNGPVKHNRVGLKSGYDPYESGLLKGGKKEAFRKKKDLAALSKWIQLKKNMGSGSDSGAK